MRSERTLGDGRPRARYRPGPRGRAAAGLLLAAALLTGCGVGDTGPLAAGAPAKGRRTTDGEGRLRVYFLTRHGSWPVTRPAPEGTAGPQAALDALLDGPTRAERGRGLRTAVPRGAHVVRARASAGAVDLNLPWVVAELDRAAVNQLVCTAAAAPGVPGGREPADVTVRVHESGISGEAWSVRCDENGAAAPAETADGAG
ncbi:MULTISPECIES: GerMN domain-containing protein [Streptomyces]|uniref:GerMN domain-containing protein n=1 Tax=Streptomyces griseoaurantiacus TaxID=68213 RepID=UPI002E3383AC|nr:GerMN domain-containing protein [Streptomyces jietaisiensis]